MHFYRKIVGKRLYLSPFDPDDPEIYAQWAAWMNDKAVADNYCGPHSLVSPQRAKKTLESLEGHRFAIVLADGDECIGHISLHDIDYLARCAFLGIFIGDAQHRSSGYGAEAIRLVLGHGFRTLNLNNISLTVHADNVVGIACYKNVGFREVGRRRECIFKDGQYIDKVYMDILAREFEA